MQRCTLISQNVPAPSGKMAKQVKTEVFQKEKEEVVHVFAERWDMQQQVLSSPSVENPREGRLCDFPSHPPLS